MTQNTNTWPDFVENMDFGGTKMLTQEEIDNWDSGYDEQKEAFEKVKPDLKRVQKSLSSALHYLHETGDYESHTVDEVFKKINDAHLLLGNLLDD